MGHNHIMMIRNYLLKDFTYIRSGYAFRGAVVANATTGVRVIQQRDIVSNDFSDLTIRKAESSYARCLLDPGCVLVTSRGTIRAHVFRKSFKAITTSAVFVLRVRDDVLPEYLAMYINSEMGQCQIKTRQESTTVSAITMQQIAGLVVPVPDLDVQERLVRLYEMQQRQKLLQNKINVLRDKLLNNILKGVLKG